MRLVSLGLVIAVVAFPLLTGCARVARLPVAPRVPAEVAGTPEVNATGAVKGYIGALIASDTTLANPYTEVPIDIPRARASAFGDYASRISPDSLLRSVEVSIAVPNTHPLGWTATATVSVGGGLPDVVTIRLVGSEGAYGCWVDGAAATASPK